MSFRGDVPEAVKRELIGAIEHALTLARVLSERYADETTDNLTRAILVEDDLRCARRRAIAFNKKRGDAR